jgi:hypothetical protein
LKTLKKLWDESSENSCLRFRYLGWSHSIKFFEVQGLSDCGSHFTGILDNGEKASYPSNSDFWEYYYEGSEEMPKAM